MRNKEQPRVHLPVQQVQARHLRRLQPPAAVLLRAQARARVWAGGWGGWLGRRGGFPRDGRCPGPDREAQRAECGQETEGKAEAEGSRRPTTHRYPQSQWQEANDPHDHYS